jgi:hypothetical protein
LRKKTEGQKSRDTVPLSKFVKVLLTNMMILMYADPLPLLVANIEEKYLKI